MLSNGWKILRGCGECKDKNINAEVINLRTLRPLDIDTIIGSVKKTNRVVACEEGFPFSGIGAEISALITEKLISLMLCCKGKRESVNALCTNLEKLALPQVDDIVVFCTSMLERLGIFNECRYLNASSQLVEEELYQMVDKEGDKVRSLI